VDFGVRITEPIADFFRSQVAEPVIPSEDAPLTIFTRRAGETATLTVSGAAEARAVLQRSLDTIRWQTLQTGRTDAIGVASFDVLATTTAFYRGVVEGTGTTSPVRGVVEAPAPPSVPGRTAFASPPTFSAAGFANAVYLGGSVQDLDAALAAAGATGAWAQTPDGEWVLYVAGAGSVNAAFLVAFPQGFTTASALTLVRQ
jgi:hypothetical protein